MSKPGPLRGAVNKINHLPAQLRPRAITLMFGSVVKYFRTTRVEVQTLSEQQAVLFLKNRRRVQNHIGGVHATAMATLAESATGMLLGMHTSASSVQVIKTMKIDYLKRASGDLTAAATLSDDQIAKISSEPKGELLIPVTVTDSKGIEPIRCEMLWAWVPSKR